MGVGMLMVRHDPTSASLVRREIAADLATHLVTDDSVADVVLVASELVSNAVVHAAAAGDLDIAWDVLDGAVLVRVTDASDEQPRPRDAGAEATDGRGLAIVAALAAEWGVDQVPTGKQVWARVPVARAS